MVAVIIKIEKIHHRPQAQTVKQIADGAAAEAQVARALALVGLSEFAHSHPHELSGGMQQRVAIARTLVHQPQTLLLDEPFGALDAITREIMNDELLRIWDKLGQSVVFITHDIDEAVYLSDRVCVLARPPGGLFRILKNKLPRPRKGPMTRTHDLFWQYKKELIADISTVTEQNPLSDEERELLKRSA